MLRLEQKYRCNRIISTVIAKKIKSNLTRISLRLSPMPRVFNEIIEFVETL